LGYSTTLPDCTFRDAFCKAPPPKRQTRYHLYVSFRTLAESECFHTDPLLLYFSHPGHCPFPPQSRSEGYQNEVLRLRRIKWRCTSPFDHKIFKNLLPLFPRRAVVHPTYSHCSSFQGSGEGSSPAVGCGGLVSIADLGEPLVLPGACGECSAFSQASQRLASHR
jgi:hypothetical protein